MAVRAKRSREFCYRLSPAPLARGWVRPVHRSRARERRLGALVDERVGLLNNVDGAFRAELRECEQSLRRFESMLQRSVAAVETRFNRWMFLFWLGTVATMVGIGQLLMG